MIECFMEDFKPGEILHRKEQESSIRLTFEQFKKHGFGTNLSILGVTGSGKTVTVKKVLGESIGCAIYFSAEMCKTTFKILRELSQTNSRDYSVFIQKIITRLKTENKILIIDELNKVEDPNNLFDALNTIYRQTGKPIIIISNNRKIFLEMPEDARLTLFLHKVEFTAYTGIEIKEIIKSRIKLLNGGVEGLIPEDALTQISAISSCEGSARDGLDLTMKCILRNCFTTEFIESLNTEKKRQEWYEFASSLSEKQKNFLDNVLCLYREDERINNSTLRKRMPQLSPQSISMLITDFIKYGVLESQIINKGKAGGRYRELMMNQDTFCKLEGVI